MPAIVRMLIAVTLLVALVLGVDWSTVPASLARLDLRFASLVVVGLAAQFPIAAWKWSWALRLHDVFFSTGFLLKVACIGFFFNNFLPSAIGGDTYRVYRTTPRGGPPSKAVSAVLVDRLVGFSSLVAIGIGAAFWLADDYAFAALFLLFTLTLGTAAVIALLAVYFGYLKFLTKRLRRFKAFVVVEEVIAPVMKPRAEWLPLIGISVFSQAIAAGVICGLFWGIGVEVSPLICAIITAGAGLASLLPISINGIGVIEGSIAAVSVAFGISYDDAVLVAILNRLLVVPMSALCGLVYLAERRPDSPSPAKS